MVSENSPFNTVSCGADPLSLRPALDVLEVEVRRRNPTPERPLMVVIGEDHYMPTHTWLRHGLIARLCAGSSPLALAYGMETPHDELTRDAYPLFREMKSPHDILTAQKSELNLQRFCQDKKYPSPGMMQR